MRLLRPELSGFFAQIHHDGSRFEDCDWSSTSYRLLIDYRRHAPVGRKLEKGGGKLVPAADIDWPDVVGETALFQHDCDFPTVRGRPVVKIDHDFSFCISLMGRGSWVP